MSEILKLYNANKSTVDFTFVEWEAELVMSILSKIFSFETNRTDWNCDLLEDN